MNTQEIVLAIGGGLLVNEFCEISPWAARKIVIWSARLRYGKSARAEIRTEEHCAVIDSRPGKLFKLMTALAFACGATRWYLHRELILLQLLLMVVTATQAAGSGRLYVRAHYRETPRGKVYVRGRLVKRARNMAVIDKERNESFTSD